MPGCACSACRDPFQESDQCYAVVVASSGRSGACVGADTAVWPRTCGGREDRAVWLAVGLQPLLVYLAAPLSMTTRDRLLLRSRCCWVLTQQWVCQQPRASSDGSVLSSYLV
jgi:hypothetical protein